MASVEERFWSKVNKTDDCWLWTAATTNGYGRITVNRQNWFAHRWSYTNLVGTIPDGLTIDHLCRTKLCVNPAHLEVVTRAENTRRNNILTTHCPQGHEYTLENTYTHRGRRQCRECRRIKVRNRPPRTFTCEVCGEQRTTNRKRHMAMHNRADNTTDRT